MSYPRYLRSRQMVKARRTSGNLTLNSTSWANVDTGIDLVLDEVQVGDELVAGISGLAGNESVSLYLDVVTVVSSTPVNSFAKAGAVEASPGVEGIQAWRADGASFLAVGGLSMPYTVVSGDLSSGSVTLRLRYATSTATNKTLRAQTNNPLDVWAWNTGPVQA